MATIFDKHVRVTSVPQALFSGDPIALTNTFSAISEPINSKGAKSMFIWVKLTIGTSVDTQVKVKAGYLSDQINYEFPIETVSATKLDLNNEVRELQDSNTLMVFELELNKGIPYLQVYAKDAAGGTGTLDSVVVTFG